MSGENLISKSKFARMCMISPQALTPLSKRRLSKAVVKGQIDLNHPDVKQYLREKDAQLPEGLNYFNDEILNQMNSGSGAKVEKITGEISSYLDMTLREIVEKFGTDVKFKELLTARKIIEEIRQRNLKNEKEESKLIPREMVRQHIFGAIDEANKKLLQDFPQTIFRIISSHIKSGGEPESGQRIVHDSVSKILKNIKSTALKKLS